MTDWWSSDTSSPKPAKKAFFGLIPHHALADSDMLSIMILAKAAPSSPLHRNHRSEEMKLLLVECRWPPTLGKGVSWKPGLLWRAQKSSYSEKIAGLAVTLLLIYWLIFHTNTVRTIYPHLSHSPSWSHYCIPGAESILPIWFLKQSSPQTWELVAWL